MQNPTPYFRPPSYCYSIPKKEKQTHRSFYQLGITVLIGLLSNLAVAQNNAQTAMETGEKQIEALLAKASLLVNNQPSKACTLTKQIISQQSNRIKEKQLITSLLLFAKATHNLGNYMDALQANKKAEAFLKNAPNPVSSAKLHCQNAITYLLLGKFSSVDESVQAGMQHANTLSDPHFKTELLLVLTELELRRQNLTKTQEHLQELAKLLENQVGSTELFAQFELLSGALNYLKGNTDKSDKHTSNALELANNQNDLRLVGQCYLQTASLENSKGQMPLAQAAIEKALEIGQQTENSAILQEVMHQQAEKMVHLGNLGMAAKLFTDAVAKSRQLKTDFKTCLLLQKLGVVFINRNRYDQPMKLFRESITLAEANHYLLAKAKAYLYISSIFNFTNEPDKGQVYLQKAIDLADTTENLFLQYKIAAAQGSWAYYKRDYPTAIKRCEQTLEIAKKAKRSINIIGSLRNLIRLNYFNGDLTKSEAWINEALAYKEGLGNSIVPLANLHCTIGQVYRLHYPKKSLLYFKKSLQGNDPTNDKKAYYFMSLVYEKLGDLPQALHYHKKLAHLRDSLTNNELANEIELLKIQFETEQKDQELAALKKDQEMQSAAQQAALIQEQRDFAFLLFFAGVALLIGLLLFNRFRLRQKTERLSLLNHQMMLEQKNQETRQKLEIEAMKTRFFTDVSHELRTPLTLIKGPLELLMADKSKAQQGKLEMMHRNTSRLLDLVNQTMDLSKLESGHFPLAHRRFDFANFVQESMATFTAQAKQKNISLALEDHSKNRHIEADPSTLERVLINLVGNAIVHTPKDGSISISLRTTKFSSQTGKQEGLKLTVTDSGKGIDAQHLPYLFDRYYQVDNSTGQGTGIGLTLCKEIVERHNGTITVASKPGKGCSFSVELPQRQNGTNRAPELQKAADPIPGFELKENATKMNDSVVQNRILEPSQPQKTVLVVDDQSDMLHHLQDIMSPFFKVLTATDGNSALEQTKKEHIDLIVSDVMMPGPDGYEITKLLKTQFATSHIPIVLLTAKASQDNKIVGLEMGADDYLSKPFHAPELLARANNLIQQREQLHRRFASDIALEPAKLTRHKIDEDFLKKAKNVVNKHLTNTEFTIEFFCNELALNRTSVHLKLKALTGMSASQYIKHIRIQKAAKLIQEGQESMLAIAEMVGFNSRQAFNKSFKEHFQVTPSEFSKN